MSNHVGIVSIVERSPICVPPPLDESHLLQLPIELLIDIVTVLDADHAEDSISPSNPLCALRM